MALSLLDHTSSGRGYDSKFRQKMEMKVMQNRNAKSPCLFPREPPHLICMGWDARSIAGEASGVPVAS